MSVKVRTKDDKKAGWQRSLASRTPKKHNLGAVAWLNFSANATAPVNFRIVIVTSLYAGVPVLFLVFAFLEYKELGFTCSTPLTVHR